MSTESAAKEVFSDVITNSERIIEILQSRIWTDKEVKILNEVIKKYAE